MRPSALLSLFFIVACGGNANAPIVPGTAGTERVVCVDMDGDGFDYCYDDVSLEPVISTNADCDDGDEDVNPYAPERTNGIDDDCDYMVDCADPTPGGAGGNSQYSVYDGDGDMHVTIDADGDGIRDPNVIILTSCDPTEVDQYQDLLALAGLNEEAADQLLSMFLLPGDVLGDDCDNDAADVYNGAPEECSNANVDNDCDGDADEASDTTDWWPDADMDGQGGEGSMPLTACDAPGPAWATNENDCEDDDPTIYLGAPEMCSDLAVDNDCDGSANEASDATAWYIDIDDDGAGSESAALYSCDEMVYGRSPRNDDCDDADPSRHPGAVELPNGRDDDCDGVIDDDAAYTTVFVVTDPVGSYANPEFLVYAWDDEDGDGTPSVILNWVDPMSDPSFICHAEEGVPTNSWWCEWNDWVDPDTGYIQIYALFAGGQDLCGDDVSSEIFAYDGELALVEWDDYESFADVDRDASTPDECVKEFVSVIVP